MLCLIGEMILRHLDRRYYTLIQERRFPDDRTDPCLQRINAAINRDRPRGPPATLETLRVSEEELREGYLTIGDRATKAVVTLIEIRTARNKVRDSAAWKCYQSQCDGTAESALKFVEIDLLRQGARLAQFDEASPTDYLVHISTAWTRPKGQTQPIHLQDRLPTVAIPLKTPEEMVSLDLQKVLDTIYDRAGYNRIIDYTQPPAPPLTLEQAAWAKDVVTKSAAAKA